MAQIPFDASYWPGINPLWSKTLTVESTAPVEAAGTSRTWHYLDNIDALEGREYVGTILCVHGNPTWSYLWRSVIAAATDAERPWRVIAVDQIDMGFSERTGLVRSLEDRLADLGDFTAAVGLDDTQLPVVTLAHDWGGLISLGWVLAHRHLVRGVMLTNTGVFHDYREKLPAALRLALAPKFHPFGTSKTTAFLDVTLGLTQGGLPKDVRATYRAPYRTESRRAAIQHFVGDIPFNPGTKSHPFMVKIAEGIKTLDVPAFFQWGTKDPVFQRKYMMDLIRRMPHAQVHRYENASHLVAEDEDIASPIMSWLTQHFVDEQTHRQAHTQARASLHGSANYLSMLSEITARSNDSSLAVVDMGGDGTEVIAQKSWAQLAAEVNRLAAGLSQLGVKRGDRINLMVPPGSRLTAILYACLKIGAVVVVADTGLGAKGLTRALKGAQPDFIVGIKTALLAAKTLGWPGARISADALPAPALKALGALGSIADFAPVSLFEVEEADPDADAAVLYTSGSTGPAKGVVYTHRQMAGMRDAIKNTYGLKAGTGLVAGFAPFALLGPGLGCTSVTPKMDVTKPKTLSASALASAAAAIDATAIFASPAALVNVVATADELTAAQRQGLSSVNLLLSAGAPIPLPLLEKVQQLLPSASLHTPYGMTEALPITDVSFETILAAHDDGENELHTTPMVGAGNGVCVGTAVYGAQVRLAPLNAHGVPAAELTEEPGITGEIVVSAPHVKDRYDTLWVTEETSIQNPGWHRTGDVGHFDAEGRLWVEGRLAHVMVTGQGVLTPVAAELAAETVAGIKRAAVVAVGPSGTATPVAVVETHEKMPAGQAPFDLTQQVRSAVAEHTGVDLAAVLVVDEHPTDVRHNSKIDRPLLAQWADKILSGKKAKLA
ncbi:alpha/beta fold hydrolase [Rothia sp. ZJ1223]|uniref:alpha/beta fold hydrolase n=1 Tax=Rothia sp. ZJ1223 TaxID=2811098 RepID=UPI00195714FA|nr:alpha/beta fold hydrolase [Rothia sp. ZJ1223]MBM7050923.1 alpha/beta fold hydrolase [Rothia sp. ZJ1223]